MKQQEKKKRGKKKLEKKLVNNERKGRERNKSKIDIEGKWGEAKKRNPTQGKKVEESCQGPRGKNIKQGVLLQYGAGECDRLYGVKKDRGRGPQQGRKLVTATEGPSAVSKEAKERFPCPAQSEATLSVLRPRSSVTGRRRLEIFLGGRPTHLMCLANILLSRHRSY